MIQPWGAGLLQEVVYEGAIKIHGTNWTGQRLSLADT